MQILTTHIRVWPTLFEWLALFAISLSSITSLYCMRVFKRSRARVPQNANLAHAPRSTFLNTIEQIIVRAEGHPYSLALFDIDGFKILNDRHGSEVGDRVLACVRRGLCAALPGNAEVVRFGSDEFLAFLPDVSLGEAQDLARTAISAVASHPLQSDLTLPSVTLSVGLASYPDTSQTLRDAISQTTSALHEAKEQGRKSVAIARSNRVGLFRLGAEVECALTEQRLCAAYQPIVDLKSGQLMAEEGLARIVLVDGEILVANQFMTAATDLRLASRIDSCLIAQTLDRCREQSSHGDRRLRFMNVSAALLRERRLLEQIAASFTSCGILGDLTGDRNPLVIEITERELLREPADALDALQPLLAIGARLAIDDFGSGYSSFLYLTSFPISFLKIEMDLVKAARSSVRARSIVKGIRNIAQDLDILTIAEGIEDEELAAIAHDLGIDWGQGFYFGRPILEGRRTIQGLGDSLIL